MDKIRILLADDHAILRDGIRSLLNAEPDLEVVGEAAHGRDAVDRATELLPDVALLDCSMPELTGVEAMRRIRITAPAVKLLALTVHEDSASLRELLEAGAHGYVLKRAGKAELLQAIHAVYAGGIYIDPRIASQLVNPFYHAVATTPPRTTAALSGRESAVMRMIAQGHTNKEVAATLDISVKTVETYRARSMEKLGLRSRVDLVRVATERGWLRVA